MRLIVAALLGASLLISSSARAQTPALAIHFDGRTVTVSGATPGRAVVVFGRGVGRHNRLPLYTRELETLVDGDGDGSVSFTAHMVPARSVWVAVDVETGEHAVATPGTTPLTPLELADSWRGNRAHLDVARQDLDCVIVRPGAGAWAVRVMDGGARDGDGMQNGIARLRLEDMNRLYGEADGPPVVTPKDVLVAIVPRTLEYFASEAR